MTPVIGCAVWAQQASIKGMEAVCGSGSAPPPHSRPSFSFSLLIYLSISSAPAEPHVFPSSYSEEACHCRRRHVLFHHDRPSAGSDSPCSTGACGKTSLLCSFALGEFPKEYQPTVFDNYVAEIRLDEKPVQLALWDTAGQEEYERLRPMSYSKSHVILIAFAIDTPDSLENVTSKWIEEVRRICGPVIPVILVGCKVDLRPTDEELASSPDIARRFVSREQGERVANMIGARAYKECSALKIEGVDEVFETATRASMLMRDGVPSNGANADTAKHHRRRSSGRTTEEREEKKTWGCCLVS